MGTDRPGLDLTHSKPGAGHSLRGRASSLDIIATRGGQSSTAAVLGAALDTKRQAEEGGSRSERPRRGDGFPARAAHPGADGRIASATTTRGRTARTPPA